MTTIVMRIIVLCLFIRQFYTSTTDYSTISDGENRLSSGTFFILAMFCYNSLFLEQQVCNMGNP